MELPAGGVRRRWRQSCIVPAVCLSLSTFPPKCLLRMPYLGRPSFQGLLVRRVIITRNVTASHTELPASESS